MTFSGTDRRRTPRYDLVAQVEVRGSSEMVMLPIHNVSSGGALIAMVGSDQVSFDVGAQLEIFLDLGSDDEGDNLAANLAAKVVRVEEPTMRTPARIGVEWVDVSAYNRQQLDRIVDFARQHAAQPA